MGPKILWLNDERVKKYTHDKQDKMLNMYIIFI